MHSSEEKNIIIIKAEWNQYCITMHCDHRDEDADPRIFFTEENYIEIGAVSFMDAKHFHGMRIDVIDALKKQGMKLLRWPGGNFAGEYITLPKENLRCGGIWRKIIGFVWQAQKKPEKKSAPCAANRETARRYSSMNGIPGMPGIAPPVLRMEFSLPFYGAVCTAKLYHGRDLIPYSYFEMEAAPVEKKDGKLRITIPPHSLVLLKMKLEP